MISILSESVIRLEEAAVLVGTGRQGKKTAFSTVLKWVLQGATAPDGQRVRLEAARVGRHWVTSKEALARWSERLTPRLDDTPAPQMEKAITFGDELPPPPLPRRGRRGAHSG